MKLFVIFLLLLIVCIFEADAFHDKEVKLASQYRFKRQQGKRILI